MFPKLLSVHAWKMLSAITLEHSSSRVAFTPRVSPTCAYGPCDLYKNKNILHVMDFVNQHLYPHTKTASSQKKNCQLKCWWKENTFLNLNLLWKKEEKKRRVLNWDVKVLFCVDDFLFVCLCNENMDFWLAWKMRVYNNGECWPASQLSSMGKF